MLFCTNSECFNFNKLIFSDLGGDLEYDGVDVKQPNVPQIPSQSATAKLRGQPQKLEDPNVERPDSGDNIYKISKTHYFWYFN